MQVADMFSLKGKVAVVAGGGGILGGAIGEGLAAAGQAATELLKRYDHRDRFPSESRFL